jgi:SAM-dependent methyltransferase
VDTRLVKSHWSTVDCSADERNFYCFPPIRARSSSLVFGEPDAGPDWCERRTVEQMKGRTPFETCLSVCCGFGHLERSLARLGAAKKFVGIDIAPGAIEEARRRAVGLNIEYLVSDLNETALPRQQYDLIWANGALHHLANLEEVVSRLHGSLRPGGYLVCTEYVGPRYQQLGARQQELVAEARALLPPELKSRAVAYRPFGNSFAAKTARYVARRVDRALGRPAVWEMPPLAFFLATDPSECVSSNRIVDALSRHFDVDFRGFGGSILYYALDAAFYRNFDDTKASHVAAFREVCAFEDAHLAELGHDNAHIICRRH